LPIWLLIKFHFVEHYKKKGYNIAGFIPKGINQQTDIIDELEKEGIPISDGIDKVQLLDNQVALAYVQDVVSTSKYVILDIGGYFAASAPSLSQTSQSKTLVGIVEDTENGHKKYEKVVQEIKCPVYSVARSPLKETEDTNIGTEIVQATESILKSETSFSCLYMDYAGVIGLGKIGKSIVHTLHGNRVQMFCHDRDPLHMAQMRTNENFPLATKDQVLAHCDIIFSATGNNAITESDFPTLRNNVYIATATSPDDELGFDPTNFKLVGSTANINRYEIGEGKYINLICNGHPPNFVYGSFPGPGLFLTQSGVLTSLNELQKDPIVKPGQIHTLRRDKLYKNSKIWLDYFANIIGK
jgi:adenosylhomocysteinase